jgi:hypothetical protein
MNPPTVKFYSSCTGLILVSVFLFLYFFKTDRDRFLSFELKDRDKIVQLVKNKNGKYQIVDIDSTLISNQEWDKVEVLNRDILTSIEMYEDQHSPDLHGLLLRNPTVFLAKDNVWWHADIFLKDLRLLEQCDSVTNFRDVNDEGLAYYWYKNRMGLINGVDGKKISQPDFVSLEQDANNNFKVESEQGKFGVIDISGKFLLKPVFDSLSCFSKEVYWAGSGQTSSLFLNGSEKLTCSGCSIEQIAGHYYVSQDDKFQLLNSSLSYQSEQFESFEYLSSGYFSIQKNGAKGVLRLTDQGGSMTINPEYREIIKEGEDYWEVESFNGKRGLYYLDSEIIPAQFDVIDLTGNYVFVGLYGKWGLWDSHIRKEWIATDYTEMEILSDNLVKVNDGSGVGLLSKSDYFYSLIPCRYTDIHVRNQYYEIERNGRVGVADNSGNEIIAPIFSEIVRNANDDLGAYFIASRNDWRYLMDSEGDLIIPEEYSFIELQGGGLAFIKNYYDLYGWYNIESREIQIKCKYEKVDNGFSYKQDIVRVYDGDESYNIDYYGQRREGSATGNKVKNLIDDGVEAVENLFK